MQGTFVNLCYSMENHCNSNYDDLLWIHGPRVGNWSWQWARRGGGCTSSKNRLESPLIYIYMKKQNNNPNWWIYCDVKSTLNVSVSITIIRTLMSGKLFIQWWMLVEITGANIQKLSYLLSISLKDRRIFLIWNNPAFSNIFPHAKHVLNTFKLRTLCARLYLFVVNILFAPVISTSIHRCVNNFPGIKVLMMVIETETFNVDFTSQ